MLSPINITSSSFSFSAITNEHTIYFREFAAGLLLVGATRTTRFDGLAFHPFPNYERFAQVNKCKELQRRMQEEARLEGLQQATLAKYDNAIRQCFARYNRDWPGF